MSQSARRSSTRDSTKLLNLFDCPMELMISVTFSIVPIWAAVFFSAIGLVYDLRYNLIPNCVSYFSIIVGFFLVVFSNQVSDQLIGFLYCFSLSLMLYFFSMLGGGDVKLLSGVGLLIGQSNLVTFLLALYLTLALSFIVAMLIQSLIRNAERSLQMPLAPSIFVGCLAVLLSQ